MKYTDKTVDVVFIGGGPATLGILSNAIKNNKIGSLVGDDGIAILEK